MPIICVQIKPLFLECEVLEVHSPFIYSVCHCMAFMLFKCIPYVQSSQSIPIACIVGVELTNGKILIQNHLQNIRHSVSHIAIIFLSGVAFCCTIYLVAGFCPLAIKEKAQSVVVMFRKCLESNTLAYLFKTFVVKD